MFVFGFVLFLSYFTGYYVGAGRPARQVLQLAPLAAERPPCGIDGMPPAEDAQGTHTHRSPESGHLVIWPSIDRLGQSNDQITR